MKRNGFLALTASMMVCAMPANAATLVQTISAPRGPGYANKLDPTIGTLNKVTIESTYFATTYLRNPVFGGEPPLVNATGRIGDINLGFYEFSGVYQSVLQPGNLISVAISGTALKVITDDFSYFVGTGLAYLGGNVSDDRYSTVNGGGLAKVPTDFPGQIGARYTITYDYTVVPFVPEPATWALMLAGFAMTGYALRRRRAKVAFA